MCYSVVLKLNSCKDMVPDPVTGEYEHELILEDYLKPLSPEMQEFINGNQKDGYPEDRK